MEERVREGKLRRLAKVEVALDERVGDAGVGSREPGLLEEGQHGVGGKLVGERWQPWNHSLNQLLLFFSVRHLKQHFFLSALGVGCTAATF